MSKFGPFDTPEPITVTLDLGAADLRVTATDRPDTVVEVRPGEEASAYDVKAAAQVRVDYADGALQVTGPRAPRLIGLSRKSGSVDITVELPAGSGVTADLQMGDVRTAGRLGKTSVRTGAGKATLERTGPLSLRTGFGHITVGAVAGDAEISTGGGQIQVGEAGGALALKTATGHIAVDAVSGDARVRTSAGDIAVGQASAGIDVKTSSGKIRLGEITRGQATVATAAGDLDIGIAEGTAAWLDAHTGHGHVVNLLADAGQPGDAPERAEVRARTAYGDITVRRAGTGPEAGDAR